MYAYTTTCVSTSCVWGFDGFEWRSLIYCERIRCVTCGMVSYIPIGSYPPPRIE